MTITCQVYGQKRTDRSKNTKTKKAETSTPAGPKRTSRTIPENQRVRVITKREFVKVAVQADKGYLSVVAVPGATVSMTPLSKDEQQKTPPVRSKVTDSDGSLNLINLPPGQYTLVIEHPDYTTFSENISVKPALLDTFVALNKIVSIFGVIRIGGAPANAKIFLDNRSITSPRLMIENQDYVISRVAVGKHRLKVSKTGFADYDKEIEVVPGPGEQTFVSAQLDPARIIVNLISEPGARVYVGNEEKAVVPGNRNVMVSLLPGRQTIKVMRDGYQEWSKELNLSLADTSITERVDLVPIPNSAEGDWQPPLGPRKWSAQSAGWRFNSSGALIKGDQIVLFDTETNRDFNTYRDFIVEFDVIFSNQKGVAWAVRAKDPKNYYLFEISGPSNGSPVFNFYVCRNGKLELKDSRPVVEKIDKPGDSFHIIFEARGNVFDTKLSIASAPTVEPYRIAIFQDNEFSWGGVGFRGKDLSEFLLQTFFILPVN